jgi:hypothetical protein
MKAYVAALFDPSCVLSRPQTLPQTQRVLLANADIDEPAGIELHTTFQLPDLGACLRWQQFQALVLSMTTIS